MTARRVGRVRSAALAIVATVALAAAAGAQQVGYPPDRSPFEDFEPRHELSLQLGFDAAQRDPARVAPHGGMITGVRYQWRAGGPAHLFAAFSHINAKRTVLDPNQPPATRDLGERSWPFYALDLGLAMSLTGPKTWHKLQPSVNAGVGLVSDFESKPDVTNGFKFGTRFAFNWGAGVRYLPGGRWGFRADVQNRLFTVAYPASYFTPPNTAAIPPIITSQTQAKSSWTNHAGLTLGIAYVFGR